MGWTNVCTISILYFNKQTESYLVSLFLHSTYLLEQNIQNPLTDSNVFIWRKRMQLSELNAFYHNSQRSDRHEKIGLDFNL